MTKISGYQKRANLFFKESYLDVSEYENEIGNPLKVVMLNLSNKGLSNLSPQLKVFSNLETLDLRNNQIQTLPEELFQLDKLWDLNLSGNLLVNLPEQVIQGDLKFIDLRNNKLRKVPKQLAEIPNIIHIDLRGNPQLGEVSREFDKRSTDDTINRLRMMIDPNYLISLKKTLLENLKSMQEDVPVSIYRIADLMGLTVANTVELIDETLKEMREIGKYYEFEEIFVKSSNMDNEIDLLIDHFNSMNNP